MRVLGIESSCDETGVALFDRDQGLLSHALHSQAELHRVYGGVVPELASRDHIQRLLPLIRSVLREGDSRPKDIDGIAYTAGPGLAGALLSGAAVARSLAWSWGVPAIGVHHMEGHLLAPLLDDPGIQFPFVALLVSGGHTQLVDVTGISAYRLLGESVDDAAGEAFDKTAKLLGQEYPGGPAIARLAESGDRSRFRFPRPMTDRPGLDFSFSGLKTFAMNTWREHGKGLSGEALIRLKADIAAAFEEAVVDTLVLKCRRALRQTGRKTLILAGGVSANQRLRHAIDQLCRQESARACYPRAEFCTDNGAMIAYAGLQRLASGQQEDLAFEIHPRWPMTQLTPMPHPSAYTRRP